MILKIGTPVLLKEYQGTHKLGVGIVVAQHRDGGREDAPTTYDVLFELVGIDAATLIKYIEIEGLLPLVIYGADTGNFSQLAHLAQHVLDIGIQYADVLDIGKRLW